jgi:hypothetical protein
MMKQRTFDPIGENYAAAKQKLAALCHAGHKQARELDAEYERLVHEGYNALTRLDEAIGAVVAFEKEKLGLHQEDGKDV